MRIEVLDHGYVEFVEAWGTGKDGRPWDHPEHPNALSYEVGIVEAARQSTQGSFRGWEQDAKLLAHLHKNNHSTPFEFAGMVIEVQAPIFVFREWHRHRTQSYNEMSARYAPLPAIDYVPDMLRMTEQAATTNKQAQSVAGTTLDNAAAYAWRTDLVALYAQIQRHYQHGLDIGMPKELARLPLPVARYSKMRAQANLRSWLAFLTLRMDPNAQWEIRQFANAVGAIISEQFPQTWRLFRPDGIPA